MNIVEESDTGVFIRTVVFDDDGTWILHSVSTYDGDWPFKDGDIYLKSILRRYSTLHEEIPHQDDWRNSLGGADLVTPSAWALVR
jgi:hypothetical protein